MGMSYFTDIHLYHHLQGCSMSLWRRQWHPTPVLLHGKSHGRRSLVGCSPWGPWGSDRTERLHFPERLHFHFSLSCIGEGNGNPLQCSCLENPRDGGAWWAAVYGVAQSWTDWSDLAAAAAVACHCVCSPEHVFTSNPDFHSLPSLWSEATLMWSHMTFF